MQLHAVSNRKYTFILNMNPMMYKQKDVLLLSDEPRRYLNKMRDNAHV